MGAKADNGGTRRVVIVGGGFAGLFAARALRRAPVQLTLIDRTEHHLFQPLLYQCATGILSEGKIAIPLRELLSRHANAEFALAEVTGIDAAARQVRARRPPGDEVTFGYDHLIIAAGVEQSYFGHDEFARFAPGMKTAADALVIRRRVFGAFEMAETATDQVERQRWLTFALVGAGPTGVELAGQIRELATKTLRSEYRHINPEQAHVLLFDGGDSPLASFGPELSARAARDLRTLGVEQHMRTRVTLVDGSGVLARRDDGTETRHEAATVLWTAGVRAPAVADAVAAATGAQRDRAGRIVVGEDLTIPGHPEISVTGDIMSLHGLPGVAEVAMQAGRYAGRRIRRELSGDGPARPFRYHDVGSAAYICRGRAVVSAGPLHVGGFLGWWIWLFIHIGFLPGVRNRVGALFSWWFAFTRDLRRERAFTMADVRPAPDPYPGTAHPSGPGHRRGPDTAGQPGTGAGRRQPGGAGPPRVQDA